MIKRRAIILMLMAVISAMLMLAARGCGSGEEPAPPGQPQFPRPGKVPTPRASPGESRLPGALHFPPGSPHEFRDGEDGIPQSGERPLVHRVSGYFTSVNRTCILQQRYE